jgi:ribosome biogenesis GTPase A
MAKGRREIEELASKLDVIIEVRDARAPSVTSSPLVETLSQIRPVWVVLSKKDLADENCTARWTGYLASSSRKAWALDLLRQKIGSLKKELLSKKPKHREVRLAVVGIPNVGKSQLLNQLTGKRSAKVGGIPGITRGVSWFKGEGLLVVDSPGILDPRSGKEIHNCLAWLGCTKPEISGGYHLLGMELAGMLKRRGLWKLLEEKWGLPLEEEDDFTSLERIGKRLGCLVSGGKVDPDLAGRRFIESFSTGKLGRVTLELPDDLLTGEDK